MDPKLREIVEGLTDEQREEIALRDALLASLRIEVAGVDVTHWPPRLPPELQPGQPAAGPSAGTPARRWRGKGSRSR